MSVGYGGGRGVRRQGLGVDLRAAGERRGAPAWGRPGRKAAKRHRAAQAGPQTGTASDSSTAASAQPQLLPPTEFGDALVSTDYSHQSSHSRSLIVIRERQLAFRVVESSEQKGSSSGRRVAGTGNAFIPWRDDLIEKGWDVTGASLWRQGLASLLLLPLAV
ncbi:hypothetical protein LSTR_LSTR001307 [Laodelphax striatellus]|uniref:Uncharacterized protein n=1 Tax=Laodelphax striatellus TaxID=195883 RepID=A0A482XGE5_LAOST|nr:hypothetical protein LSTR_LSTR001307 [Laodelphax striatellus]